MIYSEMRRRADVYLPAQMEILKRHVNLYDHSRHLCLTIREDVDKDLKENTDATIWFYHGIRFALRVREGFTSKKYGDITIRSKNRAGYTEIDKIRKGYGDYMLYCWAHQNGSARVDEYAIIDLEAFRKVIDTIPCKHNISNGDGTFFNAYSIKDLANNHCFVIRKLLS